jgi:signal transduction histidine kinase
MTRDHARHALRVLLLADSTAAGAVSALERPDAVLVHGAAGLSACRAIATRLAGTPILVVADVDDATAARLIEEGADAIIPTSSSVEVLTRLVDQAVAAGRPRAAREDRPPQLQALGRLAGGVAHDFNNLLLVIEGHVERLMHEIPFAQPHRRSVEAIAAASRRAADLTRQLLAFARGQTLIPSVIDLNATITELVPSLSDQLGQSYCVVSVLSPDIPAICADRSQIVAALTNLAANALEGMPHGGTITIATDTIGADARLRSSRPWLKEGRFVRLQFTDTGGGLDEETLARLFEPSFAGDGDIRPTRLALSSVYGIVKQSGGFIWADSQVGRGTRITILLPPSDVALPVVSDRRSAPAGAHRVLLVEDDEAVREVLVDSLAAHGFAVELATCAEDALERWRDADFDLLVTDVVLPGIDGQQLARQIRKLSSDTPVLFMSGYTGDLLEAADLGSSRAFLQKPFSSAAFVDRVRELIGAI